MSLPPDDQIPPTKPKMTAEERRRREVDRFASVRLRIAIGRELDDRGITSPAEIGVALEIPPDEVTKLLTQRRWHEGAVAQLEAAATHLGLRVPILHPWRR